MSELKHGETPSVPPKPDQPPPSPQEPLPHHLRLFPGYVHTAAERLQQGGLQGELIGQQFAADEPPILRFLETLHEPIPLSCFPCYSTCYFFRRVPWLEHLRG
jgi:hypothetical protein